MTSAVSIGPSADIRSEADIREVIRMGTDMSGSTAVRLVQTDALQGLCSLIIRPSKSAISHSQR
jgi:hypothetical protein